MSSKFIQRVTVLALVLAAIAGALAAHLVSIDRLHSRRTDRLETARQRISDALHRRTYYLEDVADMVGVHDDADVAEFTRYAHVRGLDENGDAYAVVGVQWVRRSPSGRLAPAGDVPPGTKLAEPILFKPTSRGEASRGDAVASRVAAPAIRLASLRGRVAISEPMRLANGHAGFYLAVPVKAHRYSGDVSRLESRSAIVGLIDAQALATQSVERHRVTSLRLSDGATPLASAGPALHHVVHATVAALQRPWTVGVDGGSIAPIALVLPWLILVAGLGLALAVGLVLRQSNRRRDAALRLARERAEQLEQAHAEAVRRSREDPLTGIFNRRHFGELLTSELSRVRRGYPSPAVLLLDLDHFKPINDAHGHLTGDGVLRATAERIGSVLRGSDCLARWGGEEFAVLAPGTDREGAIALAERARRALAERPVEVDGHSIPLTLSAGVAVAGDGTETPDSLVGAADRSLYAAKRGGRNCVRVSEPEAAAR